MAHYAKKYYSLNQSNSKNILLSLLHQPDDTFRPLLQIYGGNDGVCLTFKQYVDLYRANNDLFSFLNGRTESVTLELGSQLIVTGRHGNCPMLLFKQVEENRTNVLFIAKTTLERLLTLRPLINRVMMGFELSMPDIIETYKKIKTGEQFAEKINAHGFDITTFALEVQLFGNGGVTDDM